MEIRKIKAKRGFTLVEGMIAMMVLSVALIGASAYRYYAAMDVRKANLYTTAVRTATLLCEGWSGEDGDPNFNPATTFSPDLTITASAGPSTPTGFIAIGSYRIIVEGTYYYATLSWKDMGGNLKALNVIVSWDQSGRSSTSLASAVKTYQLTTYVNKPI
jgi:prepilin-type N-terminal cleavage/methylation domain-containing protein